MKRILLSQVPQRLFTGGLEKSPALLFLPGVSCTRDFWDQQTAWASRQGIKIMHGNTGHGNNIHDIAQNNLTQASSGKVLVVAHSLGCYVALRMSRYLNHNMAGLVLVNGTTLPPSEKEYSTKTKTIEKLKKLDNQKFNRVLVPQFFSKQTLNALNQEQFTLLKEMAMTIGPAQSANQLALTLQRGDLTTIFHELQHQIPITIIHSPGDNVIENPEWPEKIIHPQTRLVLDHKSGHLSPIENPDLVNRVIADSLDYIASPAEAPKPCI